MKVFNYKNEVVFEGTQTECKDFIFNQAYKMPDGRKIFRTWQKANKYWYDVGNCYYVDTPLF